MEGESPLTQTLLCMKLKLWWVCLVLLHFLLLILHLASLGSRYWLRQGDEDLGWDGSLLHCSSCSKDLLKDTYADLADDVCDRSGDAFEAWCDMFRDLERAGGLYIFFDLLSLGCLLCLFVLSVYSVTNRSCWPNLPKYILIASTISFHDIALIVWSAVAQASFGGDCEDLHDGSSRTAVCSTAGPVVATCISVIQPFYALLYVFLLRALPPPPQYSAELPSYTGKPQFYPAQV